MISDSSGDSGLSINFHLIEACNARCAYCFATFPHLGKRDRLSCSDREALVDRLVDAGVGKINFAGGEPTLMRDLGPLCKRIKIRSRGRCAVSLVTNGARLEAAASGLGGMDRLGSALRRLRRRPGKRRLGAHCEQPSLCAGHAGARRRGETPGRPASNATPSSTGKTWKKTCRTSSRRWRPNAGSCSRCCRWPARTMAPSRASRSRTTGSERSSNVTSRSVPRGSRSCPRTTLR